MRDYRKMCTTPCAPQPTTTAAAKAINGINQQHQTSAPAASSQPPAK
jgi:hypothetical protein